MDSEIRHRLTAIEDNIRQTISTGTALMAVVAALPETKGIDREKVKASIKTLLQGRADGVAMEIKANQVVDQILSVRN